MWVVFFQQFQLLRFVKPVFKLKFIIKLFQLLRLVKPVFEFQFIIFIKLFVKPVFEFQFIILIKLFVKPVFEFQFLIKFLIKPVYRRLQLFDNLLLF